MKFGQFRRQRRPVLPVRAALLLLFPGQGGSQALFIARGCKAACGFATMHRTRSRVFTTPAGPWGRKQPSCHIGTVKPQAATDTPGHHPHDQYSQIPKLRRAVEHARLAAHQEVPDAV